MDFELTLRYLYGKPQSDFDALLQHLEELINTFEQNARETSKLYGQSYLEERAKIKADFEKYWASAALVYKEAYEEISGHEHEKDAYGVFRAGYREIERDEQIAEEIVDRNHREMVDHYNKSATAMLYSILEGQLRRFADLFKHLGEHRLSVEDLAQRDYIDGIYNYLEKVIGLDVSSIESYKDKVLPLKRLRNKIMHNNAEFQDIEATELNKIVTDSNGMLAWEKEGDETADWDEEDTVRRYFVLRIKNIEYLEIYYKLIREFFNDLFWLADAHLDHQPIAERLKYAAGFVGRDIRVENTSITNVEKGKKIKADIIQNKDEGPQTFAFSITVTRANKNSFSIINQVPDADRLDRLAAYIKKNPHIILKNVLQGFNIGNKTAAVRVLFS